MDRILLRSLFQRHDLFLKLINGTIMYKCSISFALVYGFDTQIQISRNCEEKSIILSSYHGVLWTSLTILFIIVFAKKCQQKKMKQLTILYLPLVFIQYFKNQNYFKLKIYTYHCVEAQCQLTTLLKYNKINIKLHARLLYIFKWSLNFILNREWHTSWM